MFEVYEEYKGCALYELLNVSRSGQWVIKTVIRDEERILANGNSEELYRHLGLAVLESAIVCALAQVGSNLFYDDIHILVDLEMEGNVYE